MTGWDSKIYAGDVCVFKGDTVIMGPFSCHWAACAAMLRLSNPDFVSTGGDRAEDLLIERQYRERNNEHDSMEKTQGA